MKRLLTKVLAASIAVISIVCIEMQLDFTAYAYERASVLDSNLLTAYTQCDADEKLTAMVSIENVDFGQNRIAEDLRSKIKSGEVSDDEIQDAIMEYRRNCAAFYQNNNSEYAEEHLGGYDIAYISHYLPIVFLELTQRDVYNLSLISSVQSIELYSLPDKYILQLENSTNSAQTDFDSAKSANKVYRDMIRSTEVNSCGLTGNNVKIGMYESGVPERSYWSVLGLDDQHCLLWDDGDPSHDSWNYTSHATNVASIIKQVAPDAELFCAKSGAYYGEYNKEPAQFEWLMDKGVSVINASYGTAGNSYASLAKIADAFTAQYFLTIVAAVGNNPQTGGLHKLNLISMAYNTIAVGNVDINGNVSDTSCYTLMSNTSVPFRPDISAPGVSIAQVDGNTGGGTSYSAPFVTGSIALMLQERPDMRVYPDAFKAIMAASVNSGYNGTSYGRYVPNEGSSGYEKIGAGILDCYKSYQTLVSDNYESDSFNAPGYKTYTVSLNRGEHIRVALAFLCNGDYEQSFDDRRRELVTTTMEAVPNLDIELYNPANYMVASSKTTNNSLEIVDYLAAIGGTYTIRIYSSIENDSSIFFTYAWCKY